MTTRRPGPLVVATVIATLQCVASVLAVLAGLLVAGSQSNASETWGGLAAALGVAVGIAGALSCALLGVPLLVLRGATPTRRVTGRGLLVGGELLLLLVGLVVLHVRAGGLFLVPTEPVALLLDAAVAVPVVVVACLLVPSTGRWTVAEQAAP